MSQPRITYIMPTTIKRRRLLPASLRTFARQVIAWELYTEGATLPVRLLVGIDDDGGVEHMRNLIDVIGIDLGIRQHIDVIVVNAPNLGAKRNLMIACAKSPWVAFCDDDDWQSPLRLIRTIDSITDLDDVRTRISTPPAIIGSSSMLIHEIVDPRRRTFLYHYKSERYKSERYFVGGLLCFERKLWEAKPFAETGDEALVGEETWWQLSMARTDAQWIHLNYSDPLYCAFIHKLNTANRQAQPRDPSWGSYPFESLQVLLDGELAIWENAHTRLLLDPLVFRGVDGLIESPESF